MPAGVKALRPIMMAPKVSSAVPKLNNSAAKDRRNCRRVHNVHAGLDAGFPCRFIRRGETFGRRFIKGLIQN